VTDEGFDLLIESIGGLLFPKTAKWISAMNRIVEAVSKFVV